MLTTSIPPATSIPLHICAFVLIVPGGLMCLWNFYLSFLRYPLFRLKGGKRDEFRWVSGLPVIGSGLVAVAALCSLGEPRLLWPAIGLILIDTGGLHWAVGSLVYQWVTSFTQPPSESAGEREEA